MVGVVVGEEQLAEGKAHSVAHHLALGSLAAVEEQHLPLALDRKGRDVAFYRGAGGSGAEEGQGKHGPKGRGGLSPWSRADGPPVRLSVCPPVRLSVCPPVRLSVCPPVRLSARPPVRLSASLTPCMIPPWTRARLEVSGPPLLPRTASSWRMRRSWRNRRPGGSRPLWAKRPRAAA